MSIQQQIADDLKASMKARDKERTSALRMVVAALKNEAVSAGLGPQGQLPDEQVQRVLATEVKRRREAAEAFQDAGRDEQAAKEEAEAEIYATYLPAPLTDEEIDAVIDEVIADVGATGPSDMGPVMKNVMEKVGTRADGSAVSARVKQKLIG